MRQNQIKPIQIKPHQMRWKSKPNLWSTRCPKKTTLMKDPLPQKDNPYAGLVAPKRWPLIQDTSDAKTVLKSWLSSKKKKGTMPMPKTSTILHQSICLHTHKTHKFTNLQIPYMTISLQISIKSQKYKEKMRMVYLCVQAWLWYDEAVKKVNNDKMSECLYQKHKKKRIYVIQMSLQRKIEEKKKKEKGSTPEWIVQCIIVHNSSWWGAFVEP